MKPIVRTLVLMSLMATIAGVMPRAQAQASPEAALREAMDVEQIKRDLEAALKLYQAVIDRFGSTDPTVAARALFRMASIYDLKGDQRAVSLFRQVAGDYPGRPEAIQAREKLESLRISQDGPFLSRLVSTDRNIDELGGVTVSPSGRYALGLRLRELDWYLRDLETGRGRVLFACPSVCALRSAFSPDGSRVAALIQNAEPPGETMKRVRSGETTIEAVRATPRPTRLVVARTTTDMEAPVVVDLPAAPEHYVAPSDPLRWSPDGARVAVLAWTAATGTFQPRVFAVADRQTIELAASIPPPGRLEWSRTSDELAAYPAEAATDTLEVTVFNIPTGTKRVASIPSEPGMRTTFGPWTTNGEVSVGQSTQATGEHHLLLMSRDLHGLRPVCSGQVRGGDRCLGLTPDGRRLLIWNEPSLRNRVRDLATSAEHPLTTAPGEEQAAALSPDGRIALFQSNRDGRWGLYAAAIDAGPASNPLRLAWLNGGPAPFGRLFWTLDGFMGQWTYRISNLYRINVDRTTGRALGAEERLTQDGITNSGAAVSPDSRQIAYRGQFGNRTGVALMDAFGFNERLVWPATEDPSGLRPVWLSDRQVMATTNAPGPMFRRQLAVVDAGAVGSPAVTPLPDMDNFSVHQIGFNPARRELVYVDRTNEQVLLARPLAEGPVRVVARLDGDKVLIQFLVAPDGRGAAYLAGHRVNANSTGCVPSCETGYLDFQTGARTVFPGLSGRQRLAAWSADGRYLLCGTAQPMVFDRATGESLPLADSRAIHGWDGEASWAPDGSFIVFRRSSEEYEWRQWTGASLDAMLARMKNGR